MKSEIRNSGDVSRFGYWTDDSEFNSAHIDSEVSLSCSSRRSLQTKRKRSAPKREA